MIHGFPKLGTVLDYGIDYKVLNLFKFLIEKMRKIR